MYASQELLDRHQRKHSPGVVCPVCGVTVRAAIGTAFKSTGTYRAHKDKHAGTPRWRCEHCTRAFYLQSALIKHRRTHTGDIVQGYGHVPSAQGQTRGHVPSAQRQARGHAALALRALRASVLLAVRLDQASTDAHR
ncbi:Uncharacterized protein OBRU01_08806 [Operophtera brumata]|uniref:C2H2-type domain-containing protein n=1 Tax=Operophtera brumata TaxID=104452 RepID=A0A0L7LHV5_OPEBR|nr:Uncharacterized protein OBRU01_08806 [Operophtera brumata]